jgi:hypothetical protein
MNLDTSKWSQADYQTGLALLCAEAGQIECKIGEKLFNESPSQLKHVPARPALKGGPENLLSDFALMALHIAKLNELDGLNAEAVIKTGTATAASAIATPVKTGATASAPSFDPDIQLLAARGVKSYAELSALQLSAPSD